MNNPHVQYLHTVQAFPILVLAISLVVKVQGFHCQGGDDCMGYVILWFEEIATLFIFALSCAVVSSLQRSKQKPYFLPSLRLAFLHPVAAIGTLLIGGFPLRQP